MGACVCFFDLISTQEFVGKCSGGAVECSFYSVGSPEGWIRAEVLNFTQHLWALMVAEGVRIFLYFLVCPKNGLAGPRP